MEKIELKIGLKRWGVAFIFIFIAIVVIIEFAVNPAENIGVVLFIDFCAAILIIGVLAGANYLLHRKIILTDEGIEIIGYSTKTIAYKDIEKVKVGGGGLSVYDNKNSVDITNIYSTFPEAVAFLRSKINFGNINVVWGGKKIPKNT